MTLAPASRLVILYGIGGLSDVGRHAILAALEQPAVSHITVVTEYPELLDEKRWECGCKEPHTNPATDHPEKIKVVGIDSWKNGSHVKVLKEHMKDANAVISCLGHRQPGWINKELRKKGIVSAVGNKQVIEAMLATDGLDRAVVCSSIGIEEDWPPMEFHWAGKAMKWLFQGPSKKTFKDLTDMELAYKEAKSIDYLFVRPVGISEDEVPVNKWFLQKEKGVDAVGFNMAKMDVARFMVQEALNPTKHRVGVVIGSEPPQSKK
ncbi:NADPH-binding protein [Nitzschia inconspicua]|uniref:NADPH-binding protein n=1 Tax=Nitzschia inconspicua TaxID=303405 RepID=A0A9K3KD04_9STRA|nr:NADPH-binding protein [Nitzschia inconspicua]